MPVKRKPTRPKKKRSPKKKKTAMKKRRPPQLPIVMAGRTPPTAGDPIGG
jgi:hypothetical protein